MNPTPADMAVVTAPPPVVLSDRLRWLASGSLIALILLCVAWELWLAPLRPGGSWLVLKVLPLLAPLRGVLRGRLYTCQWASMLILLYFCEGVLRLTTEHGLSQVLAGIEVLLSLVFFCAAIFYVSPAKRAHKAALKAAQNAERTAGLKAGQTAPEATTAPASSGAGSTPAP